MPYDQPPQQQDTSAVIELRQYTLRPGARDTLIDLFERHFIAGQEAAGMRVQGQFRDAADPNRFVWLRGFGDMASRAKALADFYGGPVWKAHRAQANATMVDSDDVLLLRPVDARSGFTLPTQRAPAGRRLTALVVATVYLLRAPVDADFVRFFDERLAPAYAQAGVTPMARFRTETAANDFPALPVREKENAFVWFASFRDAEALARHRALLRESPGNGALRAELERKLAKPVQELTLSPTQASLLGAEPVRGDVHDFDFLEGRWNVANRRLARRGVGAKEWDEFPGENRMWTLIGSVANVDEARFPTKGWSGATFRAFDTAARQWSIWWVNSRQGQMLPPVVGGFDGDRGEFFGYDEDEGRPVGVVYRWSKLGGGKARWEQAFSYDNGVTWETNWIADFTRAP